MNMSSKSAKFAALIGIDWASQRHALCLYDCATGKRESSILEHTPEAIAQWARGLRERFRGNQIALCLEQSKGPLIYALLEYPFFVLYPINPATAAATARPSKPVGPRMIPVTRRSAWSYFCIIAKNSLPGWPMIHRRASSPASCNIAAVQS